MRDPAAATSQAGGTDGLRLLAAAGALIIAIVVLSAACLHTDRIGAFSLTALAHGGVYLVAVVLVLRGGMGARHLALILAIAVVMRLIAVTVPPALTTDAFRYVWDGRIQWAGFNPYLHVPADPALSGLRDAIIYPNIHMKDVAVTIYPPVAEIVFLIANAIRDGLSGLKVVMALFEAIIAWMLIRWLARSGLPRERVLIYAWHPLPLWEFASMVHIDVAAAGLLMMAIVAAVERRQGLAGALLATAVLTKYFPLAVLPAIWRRWDWRMPVAFMITAFVLYLPYAWGAGANVLGFLAKHLDNEGYRSGYGFHVIWILRDFNIADPPGIAWVLLALAILAGLGLYTFLARRADEVKPAHLVLIAATFVWLTSPHYPWYFGWIVPLLALHLSPTAMAMTLFCLLQNVPAPSAGWASPFYAIVFGTPLIVGAAAHLLARRRDVTQTGG